MYKLKRCPNVLCASSCSHSKDHWMLFFWVGFCYSSLHAVADKTCIARIRCNKQQFDIMTFQAIGILVKGLWGLVCRSPESLCARKSRTLDFVAVHESGSDRLCVCVCYLVLQYWRFIFTGNYLLTYLCHSLHHSYRKIKDVLVWKSAVKYKTFYIC